MRVCPRILKKLKPNYVNKNKVYGFDIETHQTDKGTHIEQEFLMGSVVGDDFSKVFWNKEEMAEFLTTGKEIRNKIVFATNLDFDFRHAVHGTKYYKEFSKVTTNGNIIHAVRRDDKRHKWRFLDTANFTGRITVAKMGEQLGLPKLEHPACFARKPKNREEARELELYNVRDSYVTQQYAKFLQQFFNSLNCRMKMTIASTGLDNWRRHAQPQDIFPERPEWIRKHYEGSFRGGRTEVFKRGTVEDVYCYDYNSMYPGVCKDGFDGRGSYPNPSSAKYIDKCDEDIIKEFEGITKVSLYSPYTYMPVLGTRNDSGKLIFPKGAIIDKWFTNVEIRTALANGYELLDVKEGIYYIENFVPFKKLVTDLYMLRLKHKDDGNVPMEKMIKTMMNSGTFGKFCQRLDGFEEEIHTDNVFTDGTGTLGFYQNDKFVPIEEFVQRADCIYVKKSSTKIPLFTMPILASYTTALSRIKLWRDFKSKERHLCYGDTDSGHFTKKVFGSGSKELGGLGFDYKFEKAVYVKPKLYRGVREDGIDVFKSKGVGKAINNEEKWGCLMNTGVAVTERFTKFKESAVRGIPFSSILKVPKNISLEDEKRGWFGRRFDLGDFRDSEPINL